MSDNLSTQQLINLLFTQITKPDGRMYTASEVADATGISPSMISALRTGKRANPSLETLRSLLDFFEVSIAYMEAKTKGEAMNIITNRKKAEPEISVRFRGMDGQGLSPKAQKQVAALLKFVVDYERAVSSGEPEPPPPRFDEEGNVIDEV